MGNEAAPFRWRRDGLVVLFAILFPSLATWLYLVAFSGHADLARLAFGICKILQFALPVIWVVIIQRDRPNLHRLFAFHSVGIGIGIGVLIVALMVIVFHGSPLMADVSVLVWDKISAFGVTTIGAYLAMALFYTVVHSFLEEYYWRWFVFGQLRRGLPVVAAVAISSVGFALHHVIVLGAYFPADHFWTATLFFSLCVAAGGAIWAWLYHRSGSLLAPWLSHLLVDAGLMGVGYFLCRGYFA